MVSHFHPTTVFILFAMMLVISFAIKTTRVSPEKCIERNRRIGSTVTPDTTVCFVAVDHLQLANWSDAESFCNTNYPFGHLASIHSDYETNVIFEMTKSHFEGRTVRDRGWCYHGLGDPMRCEPNWRHKAENNRWHWQWLSDGSTLDYTNWVRKIDNHRTECCGEFFVYFASISKKLNDARAKGWNNVNCNRKQSCAVCQYYKGESSTDTNPLTISRWLSNYQYAVIALGMCLLLVIIALISGLLDNVHTNTTKLLIDLKNYFAWNPFRIQANTTAANENYIWTNIVFTVCILYK